jgi:hypothetical protein
MERQSLVSDQHVGKVAEQRRPKRPRDRLYQISPVGVECQPLWPRRLSRWKPGEQTSVFVRDRSVAIAGDGLQADEDSHNTSHVSE